MRARGDDDKAGFLLPGVVGLAPAPLPAADEDASWSANRTPKRDIAGEHRQLEQATLARDADSAAELLAQHLTRTAAGLTPCHDDHRVPGR